jgi:cobalt-zinc-cadmium efflux system outer membrane protein
MKRRVASTVLIICALTLAAQAQEALRGGSVESEYLDPVNGLTVDAAVSQAIEHEPSLRAVQSQIDVARGVQAQAALHPNPSVAFSQLLEPAGSDNQTRVEVAWPLDLFRRSARVQVARRQVDAAQESAAERTRMIAADVRMKYGEIVAAIRNLSITEQLVTATTRQLMLVGARVDEGAATPLDRDLLRVEVQRLDADRLIQSGEVERRMIEMKRLLGMTTNAPLTLAGSLETLAQRSTTAAQTSDDPQAVKSRPDVREAEARVGIADAEIERARRDGRPDVSVVGMYMRMDTTFPQLGVTPTGQIEPVGNVFHYVSAGAMVTVPFRNRNQGAVAAAQAERTVAAAQFDAARLTAEAEIAAARLRDRQARRALAVYSTQAIGLARQNLDVVRQTYELGRGTLFDVLAEQRRYLETERAYTTALREAFDASQVLKLALGELR